MDKEISLSGMPVYKKRVLGGAVKEEKKEVELKKGNIEPEKLENNDSKKQYWEMLDEMDEVDFLEQKALGKVTLKAEEIADVLDKPVQNELNKDTMAPNNFSAAVENVDIVKINSDEVEVVRNGEEDENKYSYSGIKFKTGEVAQQLNISDQAVRNYCKDFAELLEVERTPSGQRLFLQKDIEQLREIIEFKTKNNYTTEQTIKAYKAESFFHADPLTAHDLMSAKLTTLAQLIADEVEKRNKIMIEEKVSGDIDELLGKVIEMQEKQEFVNGEYQKLIDEKNKQILELMKKNEENEQKLRQIVEGENEKMLNTMRDMLKEKETKKRWFPWGK